jgi:hypothetical protein
LCGALVAAEIVGYLAMWVPIPAAWMWIGARVFAATGSLGADLLVAFGGFFVTVLGAVRLLARLDQAWIALRRAGGHDQREGVLPRVLVVATTIAMVVFWVWFHVLNTAFVIRFLPTN